MVVSKTTQWRTFYIPDHNVGATTAKVSHFLSTKNNLKENNLKDAIIINIIIRTSTNNGFKYSLDTRPYTTLFLPCIYQVVCVCVVF